MSDLGIRLPPKPRESGAYSWATVTQSNPLRIILDTDEAPLPFTPVDFVAVGKDRPVGSRVMVLMHGHRAYVLGPAVVPADWEQHPSAFIRGGDIASVASGTWTQVTGFFVEDGVRWGMDMPSNTLVIPRTGLYDVFVSAQFAGTVGRRLLGIGLNGDTPGASSGRVSAIPGNSSGTGSSLLYPSSSTPFKFNANDVLRLLVYQDSGAAMAVNYPRLRVVHRMDQGVTAT